MAARQVFKGKRPPTTGARVIPRLRPDSGFQTITAQSRGGPQPNIQPRPGGTLRGGPANGGVRAMPMGKPVPPGRALIRAARTRLAGRQGQSVSYATAAGQVRKNMLRAAGKLPKRPTKQLRGGGFSSATARRRTY